VLKSIGVEVPTQKTKEVKRGFNFVKRAYYFAHHGRKPVPLERDGS
jgi:hypothetical protein